MLHHDGGDRRVHLIVQPMFDLPGIRVIPSRVPCIPVRSFRFENPCEKFKCDLVFLKRTFAGGHCERSEAIAPSILRLPRRLRLFAMTIYLTEPAGFKIMTQSVSPEGGMFLKSSFRKAF